MTPERHVGEVERAEPDSEHHCSPVLRPYVVTTGDSERRRGGAQRRPPPPLGLSKAHIPARQRKGSVTCYRGASLIQVRLRGDVAAGNTSGCGPRGEIVEFTPASPRRLTLNRLEIRMGRCQNGYMKQLTAIIHQGEPDEGGFWATCLEVPGANGQGETKEECLDNLREAIPLILETEREEVFRLDPKAETTELLLA